MPSKLARYSGLLEPHQEKILKKFLNDHSISKARVFGLLLEMWDKHNNPLLETEDRLIKLSELETFVDKLVENKIKTLMEDKPEKQGNNKNNIYSSVNLGENSNIEINKDSFYGDILAKNMESMVIESDIEERILTEDERISLLKQGKAVVFNCTGGIDEKIKEYIQFNPEKSISNDKWVYVNKKTDFEWTENSIYGDYTGEKNNKVACEKFAKDFFKSKKLQIEALKELTGKALGCWCYPNPCHGQVLADFVNSVYASNSDNRFVGEIRTKSKSEEK